MEVLKKQFKPILFVLMIFIVNMLLWVTRLKSSYFNINIVQTMVFGSSLLMGFFIVFFLATKNRFVVWIFSGLENLYFWHRWTAIITTALIFLHGAMAVENELFEGNESFFEASDSGELARNLFVLLIIIALLAKMFKYEHFKLIHKLLIVPYIISLYHGFFSSWVNLFSFDTLSLWMIITSLLGVGSALYMYLIYPLTAFRFKGIVVEKILLNSTTVELGIKLNRNYAFKPGQFAFIRIDQVGITNEQHPFSISGFKDGILYFTMKSLGDFTGLVYNQLKTPASIEISRPFGHMTFKENSEQLWIAGGIGITPFLGYLRTVEKVDKKIHLVYSVRNLDDAVHVDLFQEVEKANPNFKFTLHDTAKSGYLNVSHLDLGNHTKVYLCGPGVMVESMVHQINEKDPTIKTEFEAFNFTGKVADKIVSTLKKWLKKLSS